MNNESKFVSRSCAEFTQILAAETPVPGGGGAAALAGALGAALCSMVCNYTIGRKKYAAVEDEVKDVLRRITVLRKKLEDLVDQDAEAFEPLSRAYKIPADDPDRADILEKATLEASRAPMEMVRCCAEVIRLLEKMRTIGSVMMISDTGCGALLCRAAMEAAAMNVRINTRSLRDRETAARLDQEVDSLLEIYLPLAEKTAAAVTEHIKGA